MTHVSDEMVHAPLIPLRKDEIIFWEISEGGESIYRKKKMSAR